MTSPTPPIALTALVDATAPEPAPTGAGSGRGRRPPRPLRNWVGLLPFFAFLGLFLVVPTIAVFAKAFDAGDGGRSDRRCGR